MFENIIKMFKKFSKKEKNIASNSKDTAKERLHLVLMQDRANVSADFLELMKQEIIDVIKKYIEVDESAIDVRLTNKENEDGTNGAPALYANIPILNIKNETRKIDSKEEKEKKEEKIEPEKDTNKTKKEAPKNVDKKETEKVKEKEKKEENKEKNKEEKEEKQEKQEAKNDKKEEKKEEKEEISEVIIDSDNKEDKE